MSHNEFEHNLLDLLNRMFDALASERLDTDVATEVGKRLVRLNCVGHASLRSTLEVLGKAFLVEPRLQRFDRPAERITTFLAALASGHLEATRQTILDQQYYVHEALYQATREAQQRLTISETQFDEVFTGLASGVAITDLRGHFVRTNGTLGEILDRSPAELALLTFFDVVAEQDKTLLHNAYQELLHGHSERLRLKPRLLRADGGVLSVKVTMSMLRDGADQPCHYVTIVDDDDELALLRKELTRQSLHDVVTGLPNRQFFSTQLESLMHRAEPVPATTLYHLDLDAFSLITNGLGRHVGDHLLKNVAARLKSVFDGEKAIIARFAGDEFAVLVEDSPNTADVVTMIARINDELSEPVYIDGHGIAASASIGVVRHPARGTAPTELLRAADITLRRAKSLGHRQWAVFDPQQDALDQAEFSLAASMPGAWEIGEVRVVYQPRVRLADGVIVGLEALLRWDHPTLGPIPHDRCVRLAERTGLSQPIGQWLLAAACEQVVGVAPAPGNQALPLAIDLTPIQAANPDLVAKVLGVMQDTGMPPQRLQLGFPTPNLSADSAAQPGGNPDELVDNLRVLADMGVQTTVHGFGSAGAMACLEDLPISAIRVARSLVHRQPHSENDESPIPFALRAMVAVAHSTGATVVVDDIDNPTQAAWWQEAGADFAQGPFFGATVDTVPLGTGS